MIDAPTTIDAIKLSRHCEHCESAVDRDRYVSVTSARVSVFCSVPCFRTFTRNERAQLWAKRRRATKRYSVAALLIGGWFTPHAGPLRDVPRTRAVAENFAPPPDEAAKPDVPPGWFGPEWPPTETSVLAALGRDAWLHPLAGPFRRMPRSDSRVFGAIRPGTRPIECRNGHCGVDLGGEIWGEHVRAVHDGVVDWVQRGRNTEHGGRFVRIAHRQGTVFTQYFHLAAIPRHIERGVRVNAGDLIGLLGDTGVKESAPHLHFTVSIRGSKDRPERYIDPEPLIALWAMRVPVNGTEVGLVTTVAEPGLPLGSAPLLASRRRQAIKRPRGPDELPKPRARSLGSAADVDAPLDTTDEAEQRASVTEDSSFEDLPKD